ncbi:acyl-CoA thioester hydrolase/BAAT C-terminal domain-containing protein [Alicyclobacillus fodiniaquatilis]|uniref:Acyl-CoA thioester hydrolase/BAAT C-terminal domain-containing protein n=1 Tax=Alicyclobacillus fodiniaquatilis TaxID=1661150 RepID=A0ABW4JGU1_9BACL
MKRLDDHGHPFAHQHLFYPKAGHSIFPPFYPTTSRNGPFDLGGNPTDDAFAQADSWEKILQFLKDDT